MISPFYVEPNGSLTSNLQGINNQSFVNNFNLQAMNIAAAAIALGLHKNELNSFYNQIVGSFSTSAEEYFELMLNTAIKIIEKRGE